MPVDNKIILKSDLVRIRSKSSREVAAGKQVAITERCFYFDKNFSPAKADHAVHFQALTALCFDEATFCELRFYDIFDGIAELNSQFLNDIGLSLTVKTNRTADDDRAGTPFISLVGYPTDISERMAKADGVEISKLAKKRLHILSGLEIFKNAKAKLKARTNKVHALTLDENIGYSRVLALLDANLLRRNRLAIEWIPDNLAEAGSIADGEEDDDWSACALALDDSEDEVDLTFTNLVI